MFMVEGRGCLWGRVKGIYGGGWRVAYLVIIQLEEGILQ